MTYTVSHRKQAVLLRKAGKTHREIARSLGVSVSSAFLWVESIKITPKQKRAIGVRRNQHHFTAEEKRQVVARLRRANTKFSDNDLIKRISVFYDTHGRVPFKHEFNAWRIYAR